MWDLGCPEDDIKYVLYHYVTGHYNEDIPYYHIYYCDPFD